MFEGLKNGINKIGNKIVEHKDTVVKAALGVGGTIAGLGVLKVITDRMDACNDYDEVLEIEEYEVVETEETEDKEKDSEE